jgi:predicted secreted Zn-dependent protease
MVLARSWVYLPTATDYILQHEQLHFDLYEVYRRKLELCMLEINGSHNTSSQGAFNELQASLAQVFSSILQRADETQALYDSQTSHSTNASQQARWQGLISQWLLAPLTAP